MGRFDDDGSFKTKGSITTEGSLTVGNSITAKSIVAEDGIINGNLFVINSSEEVRIGAKYNNESGTLWMYGRPDRDLRGIWDTKINDVIIQINDDNFVRFNGTANKADILATSHKLSISSTAGETGTNFNGGTDVSLVIPSSVSGFTKVEGKLLQIKRDDAWPYLSLLYGDYSKGTCYLSGSKDSSTARIGFYVYSKDSATNKPTNYYINFKLPEVASDLASSQTRDILVADTSGNIPLDRSLYLNVTDSSHESQRLGIRYTKNNTSSSSTFYMFANVTSGDRGIQDSATGKSIVRIGGGSNTITFNGTDFNASNNMYVNEKKVYHEGTIVYSPGPPDSPDAGMIWLKPLSQTQG